MTNDSEITASEITASEITALVHIEVVHDDPDSAAAFMEEVFGAERAEPQFARFCQGYNEDSGSRVVHVRAGNTIFQFIRPSGSGSWRDQLDATGPGVHNITVEVSNLEGAREQMLARGCRELLSFSADFRAAGYESDADATGYAIDASEQIGLRLEMVPVETRYEPGR
jgi:hypothetical protein